MTVGIASAATCVIGAADISTLVEEITPSIKMEAKKFAGMGGAGVVQIPGPPDTSWDISGACDSATDAVFGPWALENPQSARTVTIADAAVAQYSGSMYLLSYDPDWKSDDIRKFKATVGLASGVVSRS